jgi:hypothetical protein
MISSVRTSISCAIAVAGVSALVSVPAPAQERPAAIRQPAVALTAQVQPWATPTTLTPTTLAFQPLTLAVEQVNFHVGLFVDFIVTGAQLVGRQVRIPGTLLQDLGNGTPLPVALSRAVRTFVEIELDAGRELVGFAAQYIDFQVRFIAKLLRAAVAVATAIPVAVGELVTSSVSHFAPAPAAGPNEAPSVRAAQHRAAVSPTTTSENDALTDSKTAFSPTATESTVDADDETKVSAQGEIRSNALTRAADGDATESTVADEGDATGTSDTGVAEEKTAAEDVSQAENQQHDDVKSTGDKGADDAAQGNAGE